MGWDSLTPSLLVACGLHTCPRQHGLPPQRPLGNSLAMDVHDVGDVSPLPAVNQEMQGIRVPVGSWGARGELGMYSGVPCPRPGKGP